MRGEVKYPPPSKIDLRVKLKTTSWTVKNVWWSSMILTLLFYGGGQGWGQLPPTSLRVNPIFNRLDQIFLKPKIFLDTKMFSTKYIFRPKIFSTLKYFRPKIFFDQKPFIRLITFDPGLVFFSFLTPKHFNNIYIVQTGPNWTSLDGSG